MNEPESPKDQPRRGRDFLIGFGAATIYVLVMGALTLVTDSPAVLQFGLGLLFFAGVILLVKKRPFIALGIVAAIVAVPVLFVGTCFAIVGLDFIHG